MVYTGRLLGDDLCKGRCAYPFAFDVVLCVQTVTQTDSAQPEPDHMLPTITDSPPPEVQLPDGGSTTVRAAPAPGAPRDLVANADITALSACPSMPEHAQALLRAAGLTAVPKATATAVSATAADRHVSKEAAEVTVAPCTPPHEKRRHLSVLSQKVLCVAVPIVESGGASAERDLPFLVWYAPSISMLVAYITGR